MNRLATDAADFCVFLKRDGMQGDRYCEEADKKQR
jgi:hypothetical protein